MTPVLYYLLRSQNMPTNLMISHHFSRISLFGPLFPLRCWFNVPYIVWTKYVCDIYYSINICLVPTGNDEAQIGSWRTNHKANVNVEGQNGCSSFFEGHRKKTDSITNDASICRRSVRKQWSFLLLLHRLKLYLNISKSMLVNNKLSSWLLSWYLNIQVFFV